MKKQISWLLTIMLVFTMVTGSYGCGKATGQTEEAGKTETTEQETQEESKEPSEEKKGEDEEEKRGIEVDKNLLTVDITLPASFFEDDEEPMTQEKLDKTVSETDGINSAKLNDDGSVTYNMTKAKQKEMMDDFTKTMEESLTEMVEDDSYSFTDITHNADFTEFVVTTTSESIGLMESITVLGFYMMGGYYNAFAGNKVDDIIVKVKNSESGEIIEESSYKAYMERMNDDSDNSEEE